MPNHLDLDFRRVVVACSLQSRLEVQTLLAKYCSMHVVVEVKFLGVLNQFVLSQTNGCCLFSLCSPPLLRYADDY